MATFTRPASRDNTRAGRPSMSTSRSSGVWGASSTATWVPGVRKRNTARSCRMLPVIQVWSQIRSTSVSPRGLEPTARIIKGKRISGSPATNSAVESDRDAFAVANWFHDDSCDDASSETEKRRGACATTRCEFGRPSVGRTSGSCQVFSIDGSICGATWYRTITENCPSRGCGSINFKCWGASASVVEDSLDTGELSGISRGTSVESSPFGFDNRTISGSAASNAISCGTSKPSSWMGSCLTVKSICCST